jgi:hypothetical protein
LRGFRASFEIRSEDDAVLRFVGLYLIEDYDLPLAIKREDDPGDEIHLLTAFAAL